MAATDSATAHRIAELVDRLTRLTRTLQYCEGLNPAQWEALRYLARANRYSRTPSGLADYLGVTKGTVSQSLIALEEKGLVARLRCRADRREVELALTPAAESLLQRDPATTVAETAGRLCGDDGPHLVRGLSRLLHDLQERHGIREFGVCRDCTLHCVEQTAAGATALQCGKTGEALSTLDAGQICGNFRKAPASA